jgi:hypothetical protein
MPLMGLMKTIQRLGATHHAMKHAHVDLVKSSSIAMASWPNEIK